MNRLKKYTFIVLCGFSFLTLSGCAPEVGSDRWCAEMKEKPKTDWTAKNATDFASYCILN